MLPANPRFDVVYEGKDPLPIRAARFAPNGTVLAIGTNSKIVELVDVQKAKKGDTKCKIATNSEAHTGAIYSLDFSKDGKLLASGSMDKTCSIFSADLNRMEGDANLMKINTLVGHSGMVRSVSFSPDSKQLLSAGQDINLKLWDVETGILKNNLLSSRPRTYSAKFDPKSSLIFGVGPNCNIEIWDSLSGKIVDTAQSGTLGPINYLCFGYDEVHDFSVAFAHTTGSISLWDTRKLSDPIWEESVHEDECRSVEFSSSMDYLLTSSFDCSSKIVDLETHSIVAELSNLSNHFTRYSSRQSCDGSMESYRTSSCYYISRLNFPDIKIDY